MTLFEREREKLSFQLKFHEFLTKLKNLHENITFGMAPDDRSYFGDGLRDSRCTVGVNPPPAIACDDDDGPIAFGRWFVCLAVALVAGVEVYGLKLLCCPDICLTDLHAPQIVVDMEFFSVQCVHTQNSPFRNVNSSIVETLFSLDPPHTMHVVACVEFTSVHFLQVQTFCGKSTVSTASSSVKSDSPEAIGISIWPDDSGVR